ncbi:MAG: YlxR family protein [Actinomycetota bacterium]|nr:YlxR family protein [Actinomycetota bacterium]
MQRFHAERGELVPGAGAGRGAYTCRRLSCFERAAARRAFSRTLRATIRVDRDLSRLYT